MTAMTAAPTYRATFTITALRPVAGGIRRELKRSAAEVGLALTLQEDKGLIESLFIVKVDGPRDRVTAWSNAVTRWIAQM